MGFYHVKWGYLAKINGRYIPLTLRGVQFFNGIMGSPFSSGNLLLALKEIFPPGMRVLF